MAKKRTKWENNVLYNSKLGAKPPRSLHFTKIAGKLFFTHSHNLLISNNFIFTLNPCAYRRKSITISAIAPCGKTPDRQVSK